MNYAFFFQTKQIPDDTILFNEFKQQNIFFSYFQVEQAAGDQNYYLFLYADESRLKLRQQSIDINFLYQSVEIIQELNSKKRKIRSLRAYFLYALEIIQNGKDYEILETNLQPFFWKKVHNIIRQNKKVALQEFLFGSIQTIEQDNKSVVEGSIPEMEDKIAELQNQVHSLQQKIRHLEITISEHSIRANSKDALSEPLPAIQRCRYKIQEL